MTASILYGSKVPSGQPISWFHFFCTFSPCLFPVVWILSMPLDYIVHTLVEAAVFWNGFQGFLDYYVNVIGNESKRIHGTNVDSTIPSIAIIHDMTDFVWYFGSWAAGGAGLLQQLFWRSRTWEWSFRDQRAGKSGKGGRHYKGWSGREQWQLCPVHRERIWGSAGFREFVCTGGTGWFFREWKVIMRKRKMEEKFQACPGWLSPEGKWETNSRFILASHCPGIPVPVSYNRSQRCVQRSAGGGPAPVSGHFWCLEWWHLHWSWLAAPALAEESGFCLVMWR